MCTKMPFFHLRKTFFIASLAGTALLSSCNDDDADNTLPEVTITSSAQSTTVWNTVTLTADAQDDLGIDKIEIKVDGTSVGSDTSVPFDFEWNTQTVTDGEHTVSAVATDKSGNQETAELTITVQNTLIDAHVKADMLQLEEESDYQQRGFIFLSDAEGKVIVAKEFVNGEHIQLKAANYDGNEFYVTEVTTEDSGEDSTYLL